MDEDELPDQTQQVSTASLPHDLTQQRSSLPNITDSIVPEKPHHPILSFPQRTIGKQKRSFCSSWYVKYPWLHYQEHSDSVLCYCHMADKRHLPISANKEAAFTTSGFSNWKRAIEKFNKHETSMSHRQAVDFVEKIPRTTMNVGNMLSSTYAQQKAENRAMQF